MITVPFINPLRFKKKGFLSEYNTKYFDEHHYEETALAFEDAPDYFQKFNLTDPLVLYMESDMMELVVSFVRLSDGGIQYSESFTPISARNDNGLLINVFVMPIDFANAGSGTYMVEVADTLTTIESNKICIETSHKWTVQAKYLHRKLYEDVIPELMGNHLFCIRLDGFVRKNKPARHSTTYEDQTVNHTQLKTIPYNSWTFVTESGGVPAFIDDIMNRAFGCSTLLLDGRLFTVPGEAEWEEKSEEKRLLRGWGIDLRETVVRSSNSWNLGGRGTPPIVTPLRTKIDSDWFTTVAGENELPHTITGGLRGYSLNNIIKVLEIDRDGIEMKMVTGTPVNRQAKFDDSNSNAKKIVFDPDIPFAVDSNGNPETVFVLFETAV